MLIPIYREKNKYMDSLPPHVVVLAYDNKREELFQSE